MLLTVNGEVINVAADPDMPLLWALRDVLGLTGTKYGCGIGMCGACTVHLNGEAVRSCQLTLGSVETADEIVTIEGLGRPGALHPVQAAWVQEQVAQCGYCQSGQIMSAAALLARDRSPDDEAIAEAMNGNLCRCGTYDAIRAAIARAARGDVDTTIREPEPSSAAVLSEPAEALPDALVVEASVEAGAATAPTDRPLDPRTLELPDAPPVPRGLTGGR